MDSNLPLVRVGTEDERVAESLASYRYSIQLMTVFAAIAAILEAIGIYGVLAYLIDQRRRELGIRIAIGTRTADILGLVLRQSGLSIVIGLAAVPAGLVLVALLAMALPASPAARVDPVEALRQE